MFSWWLTDHNSYSEEYQTDTLYIKNTGYTGGIFTILKHHNQLVITDFEKKSKKII